MFDSHGTLRLARWREFRNNLETSQTAFQDVAELWSRAPLVNPYLDPSRSQSWPDPWHLIIDNRYDDLAIVLGMYYTLKLTQRFIDLDYVIHTSVLPENKTPCYFLVVDCNIVLNLEYRTVLNVTDISAPNKIIWTAKTDTINKLLYT